MPSDFAKANDRIITALNAVERANACVGYSTKAVAAQLNVAAKALREELTARVLATEPVPPSNPLR